MTRTREENAADLAFEESSRAASHEAKQTYSAVLGDDRCECFDHSDNHPVNDSNAAGSAGFQCTRKADVNAIPSLASMTQAIWSSLSTSQKESIRDNSGLSRQLLGLEGWRVEVIRLDGSKKRFIVGKSTGWRPCHLEISRRSAFGGGPADKEYQTVKSLYKAR